MCKGIERAAGCSVAQALEVEPQEAGSEPMGGAGSMLGRLAVWPVSGAMRAQHLDFTEAIISVAYVSMRASCARAGQAASFGDDCRLAHARARAR